MSIARSSFVVAVLALFAAGFLFAGCRSDQGMRGGEMGMTGDVSHHCDGCGKAVALDAGRPAPECCGGTMMRAR